MNNGIERIITNDEVNELIHKVNTKIECGFNDLDGAKLTCELCITLNKVLIDVCKQRGISYDLSYETTDIDVNLMSKSLLVDKIKTISSLNSKFVESIQGQLDKLDKVREAGETVVNNVDIVTIYQLLYENMCLNYEAVKAGLNPVEFLIYNDIEVNAYNMPELYSLYYGLKGANEALKKMFLNRDVSSVSD